MIYPRIVRQCVTLCVVGLAASMLGSPAVAIWRSVDDSGLVVDMAAPGLSSQTRRDSAQIDDVLHAKSMRSCWGDPGSGKASTCITYQAISSAISKFPYLRATSVVSVATATAAPSLCSDLFNELSSRSFGTARPQSANT